jgi:hypothetical protein
LLLASDYKRTAEIGFCFRFIRLGRFEFDLSGGTMDLRLPQRFPGRLKRRDRLANAAPSVIRLVEFRMGYRQAREI